MALLRIDEFNLRSQHPLEGQRIKGAAVHSDQVAGMLSDTTHERIGTVSDVLVNEAGHIQYFVIDLGTTPSGRQVLLAADRARFESADACVYALGLSKEQAEMLPEFNPGVGNREIR